MRFLGHIQNWKIIKVQTKIIKFKVYSQLVYTWASFWCVVCDYENFESNFYSILSNFNLFVYRNIWSNVNREMEHWQKWQFQQKKKTWNRWFGKLTESRDNQKKNFSNHSNEMIHSQCYFENFCYLSINRFENGENVDTE